LQSQADIDVSELEYILEYYSLVREGKTNYISALAFHDVTGTHPQELPDFFRAYAEEFEPKQGRQNKTRRTNAK
jgi:hypothetical protein